MSRRVVVTGAAGGVGMATSLFLVARGYTVVGFVAAWDEPGRVQQLQTAGVEVRVGDVCEPGAVRDACLSADALVHTAAALPTSVQTMSRSVQEAVNVRGTEQVFRAACEAGVSRLIFLSTAGVASHHGRGVHDETAPYRIPQNTHVWSKIEAERILDRLSAEQQKPVVILRPASIYGEAMRFRWPEIIASIKRGTMMMVGRGDAAYPLIHVNDLALAIQSAIELPALTQTEKFIIASDEVLTIGGIMEHIRRELQAPPIRHVPYLVALIGAYVVSVLPLTWRPSAVRAVTPDAVREYAVGHTYDTGKARRMLGFEARTRFADGIAAVLRTA